MVSGVAVRRGRVRIRYGFYSVFLYFTNNCYLQIHVPRHSVVFLNGRKIRLLVTSSSNA
jgi:hypothetical protein